MDRAIYAACNSISIFKTISISDAKSMTGSLLIRESSENKIDFIEGYWLVCAFIKM